MDFIEKITAFKLESKLTNEECAKRLGMAIEDFDNLKEAEKKLSEEEKNRILDVIKSRQKNKRRRIFLDLFFRFVAMVMSLTVLLLSINEKIDTRTLIVLLSIGIVCSSLTILPKIEKE